MTILGKDKIRLILRVLQYTPVAITFFFTLSFWREGDTEGAVAIGAVCIGLMLLNLLLHITHIRDKLMAIRKPLGLIVSILIISIGMYSLVLGNIYMGIFYALIGMNLIFDKFLKGRWKHICCAVTLGIAVGVFILYLRSD
jgi:hypothetical protein